MPSSHSLTVTRRPSGSESDVNRAKSTSTRWFLGAMGLLLVVGVGFIIAHREWHPISDWALTDLEALRVRDAFPLIGSYSRLGWSHPGPAFTLMMAASTTLAGGSAAGLLLGMLLVHMGSLVLAWFGGLPLGASAAILVTSTLLLTWAWGTNATGMLHPWNPNVSLLGAGALIMLACNAAARHSLGAWLMAPVASVLIQAHIGTAMFALLVGLGAVVLALWPWGQQRPIPWRAWFFGSSLTLLLWAPPLIEQFTREPGNLTLLIRSDPGATMGLGAGWAALTGSFALPPCWWSSQLLWLPDQPAVPWLLALPVVATVIAARSRERLAMQAMGLAWLAILAIVPTVARVDEPFGYLVQWIPAVVMVTMALSLWVIVIATGTARYVTTLAPLLIGVPTLVVAGRILLNPPPYPNFAEAVDVAVMSAADSGLSSRGVYLAGAPDHPWESLLLLPGLYAGMARAGIPVAGPLAFHESRAGLVPVDRGDRAKMMVRLVEGPLPLAPDGWRILGAKPSSLSPEQLARVRGIYASLEGGDLDSTQVIRLRNEVTALTTQGLGWQILLRDE